MDIIRSGVTFTQTIKNVSRFREIVAVFAKNGFDEFMIQSGMHPYMPSAFLSKTRIHKALNEFSGDSWSGKLGYRLRRCFESLGPSFVKIGQFLSTREDIFPADFIQEMKGLQDQVEGIDFDVALEVIEKSIGKAYTEVFKNINSQPIGTASIGVVYSATLHSGEPVVIKVKRPDIRKMVRTDFALLKILIGQIEKVSDEIRHLGIGRILEDFEANMISELDFNVEARNCEKLKRVIQKNDPESLFHLPKIYSEFSNADILVMEQLQGVPFTRSEELIAQKEMIQPLLTQGVSAFIKALLAEGVFHADLHGGNFFLLKDNQIGLVDFGLVGTLSRTSRDNLVAILYYLIQYDFENLVYEFLDVAESDQFPDVDQLIRDVRMNLSSFVGLTVQEVNISLLFQKVSQTLSKHQLYLPREWYMVFRALVALDGVGKSLKIDFDIFGLMEKDLQEVIEVLYSKDRLLQDGLASGRDILKSFKGVPRYFRWFAKDFSNNQFRFKLDHGTLEKAFLKLSGSLRFLAFVILTITFFSFAFISQGSGDPILWGITTWKALTFWTLGACSFLWGSWRNR